MPWNIERRDRVAVLRYNNPPCNFLTFQAFAELEVLLVEAGDDPAIHVIVLASKLDGYFAAHADLDELSRIQDGPVAEAKSWYTALRAVERVSQPVIALLNGQVWGGGFELALACDLRIAMPDAHFRLLETDLGFIPGAGGTQRLARQIGIGRAADLILSGRTVQAHDAKQLGIVEQLLEAPAAFAYIESISSKPRAALIAAKRALREGTELPLRDGLKLEGQLFGQLLATPEARALVAQARAELARV